MKVGRPIMLSGCLGFVVGFAVCLGLRTAGEDETPMENPSLSTNAQFNRVPVVASDESVSSNARSEPESFGHREKAPRVFVPREEWKVTIWYQTLPPQRGTTHDPREYVAQRMGLTNR